MKIVFLILKRGEGIRGAEVFVQEVSKRLGVRNKVDVITGKVGDLPRWPLLWRAYLDPWGLAVAWFTLKKAPTLWSEKYDVVVPVNGGWQPAIVRLLTWLRGGKMVISGQSGKGWDDRNNLWCFPNMFVSLSTKLKNWAKAANPFVKVEQIPNGVDLIRFNPSGKKVDFKLERPVILSVGALEEDKRMDLVLKAVARFSQGSLVVVGRGSQEGKLAAMGERLLKGRFLITSFDFDMMPQVYRGADLFTLASPWYRSFEIVIVEAMASNLPVVVNNDEIRAEIVGDAGLLVDPTNSEEYAGIIKNALDKHWGEKPRMRAKKFDWDEIAGQYEELFESLTK